MPLLHKIEENSYLILVWELSETENQLILLAINNQIQFSHLTQNVKLEQKRRERLGAVICLNNELGNNVFYEIGENGKPFLKNSNKKISISNTGCRVTVMISNNNCGIDYQIKTNQLTRIVNKFANEDEQKTIANYSSAIDLTHWIWSSKEAIYKKHNKKGLSFKNDITLKNVLEQNKNKVLTFEVCINNVTFTEKTDCTLLHDFYMACTNN